MLRFIFDLDGTVTSKETLPLIANHFGVQQQIEQLTKDTINGRIPFVESFIRRVQMLGKLSVSEINSLIGNVSLYQNICLFLENHKEQCIVATGNVYCWIEALVKKLDIKYYCSEAIVENNQIKKLTAILKKENVVKQYQDNGDKVVFVGDGNNDMEAMRLADISIASGLTHSPAQSILSIANYAVFCEDALCRLLNQLL
jgi:HAD superfamily phosphoserine phosphatase-like hydrolase